MTNVIDKTGYFKTVQENNRAYANFKKADEYTKKRAIKLAERTNTDPASWLTDEEFNKIFNMEDK